MTAQPQRPAFGTLLTSHMAVATFMKRPLESPARSSRSRRSNSARLRTCCITQAPVSKGSRRSAAPTGPYTSFAWIGIFERMRQSARQLVLPEPDAAQLAEMVRAVDQTLPRCGSGSAGRLVSATHSVRHDGKHRRGRDAGGGRHAVGARKSGVGLFCRRREAAAHPGR